MDNRTQSVENRKKVAIEDLYEFRFISDIAVNEHEIYFVVNRALQEENTYESALYVKDKGDGEPRLLRSGRIRQILHAEEDGVFFLEQDKESSRILKLSRGESEAKLLQVFDRTNLQPSPIDASTRIFAEYRTLSEDNLTEEYKIFEELPFWANAKRVIDRKRLKLYLQSEGKEKLELTTMKEAELIQFKVSSSRKRIAFVQNVFDTLNLVNHSILLYEIEHNKTFVLKKPAKRTYSNLCFFDEDTLFYTEHDPCFPGKNPKAYLLDLKAKKEYSLPYQDADFSGTMVSDMVYGRKASKILSDGSFLYFTRSVGSRVHLFKMDKRGTVSQVSKGEQTVLDFALYRNELYLISMKETALSELYRIDLQGDTGTQIPLTQINKRYVEEHHIIKPEKLCFRNREDIEIESFLMLPEPAKEGKKIPLVLQVHGGPKTVYTDMFTHEFQVLAANGFAVLSCNPRGSDGRGSEFSNLMGDFGYKDYEDILEALDYSLASYPELDAENVFICGESYGGFLVNWAITHSKRFKAACSCNSISNFLSKSFTTDIGYKYNLKQILATPWDGIENFELHSPIHYVERCKTPTLFLHSDEDYRCWISESVIMYNGLKEHACDARICVFHGEHHGISLTGKPHNKIRRLREIVSWFNRYR